MKPVPRTLATALPILVLFVLASCAFNTEKTSTPAADTTAIKTQRGGAVVETYTTNATVTAVDAQNRKVTLAGSDGRKSTYKADKQVVNFDQIKVGDQVNATFVEEVAVFLSRDQAPPGLAEGTAVALAPKGAKPGIVMADTVEVAATVQKIDVTQRQVTLGFVDGSSKTVKVGKGVDLESINRGDDVTAQVTEAVAIAVEKP